MQSKIKMLRFKHKRLLVFGGVILSMIVFMVYVRISQSNNRPLSPHEPIAQMPVDKVDCVEVKMVEGPSYQSKKFQSPKCSNIIHNIADGAWVERDYDDLESDKNFFDKLYADFRVEHDGFSEHPFRKDGSCGFLVQHVDSVWGDVSSWCHPKSSKPCCSDRLRGVCVEERECILHHSVNVAKYVHAEVSDWILKDKSCEMVQYSQETACALLHKKQVKSIGFIGNSLLRNMYSLTLQLLTNNFYNGSILSCINPSLRQKCVNYMQNMDKFCLGIAAAVKSEQLRGNGVCNGHLNANIYREEFWMAYTGPNLTSHVETLLNQPGTYLIVGIGIHDRYNATKIIEEYLKPVFEILKGHEWPKFLWVHQLKSGLFKPPGYIRMHGSDDDIDKYVEEVDKFCKEYNIPALDFRPLTTGVWSVDGTHYGRGVNLMKIQMFLNLLASDQVF